MGKDDSVDKELFLGARDDPQTCGDYITALIAARPDDYQQLLSDLHPRLPHRDCREHVERLCQLPTEPDRYWRPPPECERDDPLLNVAKRISHHLQGAQSGEN